MTRLSAHLVQRARARKVARDGTVPRRRSLRATWTGLFAVAVCCGLGIWLSSDSSSAAQPAQKGARQKARGQNATAQAQSAPGTKLDTVALARQIDEKIQARLDAENIKASPRTEDAE